MLELWRLTLAPAINRRAIAMQNRDGLVANTAEFLVAFLGQGIGCRGSRLLATSANGCPAFAAYKPSGPGTYEPWAIQVIESSDGLITGLHHFLYPELFEAFGFPARLEP